MSQDVSQSSMMSVLFEILYAFYFSPLINYDNLSKFCCVMLPLYYSIHVFRILYRISNISLRSLKKEL